MCPLSPHFPPPDIMLMEDQLGAGLGRAGGLTVANGQQEPEARSWAGQLLSLTEPLTGKEVSNHTALGASSPVVVRSPVLRVQI